MTLKRKKENLKHYLESFNPEHLYSVIQFFEWFECCQDLIAPIQKFLATKIEEIAAVKRQARKKFLEAGMPNMSEEDRAAVKDAPCIDDVPERERHKWVTIPEPTKPVVVVGFCPKCTSTMVGDVMPRCESEVTGRHFYSECTVCSYYTEIFKGRKGRYIEMKGG